MKDGDKLFLYDGVYVMDRKKYLFQNKSIQIEGIGECAIAMQNLQEDVRELCIAGKLSIKNVCVHVWITVHNEGEIFLTDTKVSKHSWIWVDSKGHGKVIDCYGSCFQGYSLME